MLKIVGYQIFFSCVLGINTTRVDRIDSIFAVCCVGVGCREIGIGHISTVLVHFTTTSIHTLHKILNLFFHRLKPYIIVTYENWQQVPNPAAQLPIEWPFLAVHSATVKQVPSSIESWDVPRQGLNPRRC